MPVLAIGGSHSAGNYLEQSFPPLAENVRGLVFEECGHFVADEQPDWLAHELETFSRRMHTKVDAAEVLAAAGGR